ncbi:hypothetical protein ACWD25_20685 [Streptomyces sp. NPDC002920]
MTEPLTPEREQEIRESIPTAYGPPWTQEPDMEDGTWRVMYATDHPLAGLVAMVPDYGAHLAEFIATARAAIPELLDEIDRLRDDLAEEKASWDPLLRCLLVKVAPDRDRYVGWSNVADGPTGVWSRESALEFGFPRSVLDRVDANGSSATGDYRSGHWDDTGFVADQRGWLPRARIGDYAVDYLLGDHQAAYALLEPFEGEKEVRR